MGRLSIDDPRRASPLPARTAPDDDGSAAGRARRRAPATGPCREAPLLIVNADDFGSSKAVNRAVVEAHRHGILTSASLMVTGAACEDAVRLAGEHPDLAVGLHLVLLHERAAAAPGRIPRLIDGSGRLPRDPVIFGLRLAADARLRQEVATEIGAQLDRFAATGLRLSHVDGHLNFHMHPAVLPALARGAAAQGARGIRLPRDELALAWRHGHDRLAVKLTWAAAFGALSAWAEPRLPRRMRAADRVFGLFQSGCVTPAYVLDVLRRLHGLGSAELYLHPSTEAGTEPLGPNPGDLATLLDPTVLEAIRVAGVRLVSYEDLVGR